MSIREVAVVENRYFDSVFLMAVARRLAEQPGIESVAAVMGSDANKQVLRKMGFDLAALQSAGVSDLLIAVHGEDAAVKGITSDLDPWLAKPATALSSASALSLDDALSRQSMSNLAVISVPGEHAAREAHEALDRGLNVFLFSDHVDTEDELTLKRKASEKNLIVMGPDCGTALIAGTGIGFANVVRRGPIGVIASSGTGLQEFTSLVHRAGSGISHGLGTGGRDLSDKIGGLSTLAAISSLEEDPQTEVIAIVSKPPGQATLHRIAKRLDECAKPVVACFLGIEEREMPSGLDFATHATIDEAVQAALHLAGHTQLNLNPKEQEAFGDEQLQFADGQRYMRGLFAGGTFCYQAQQVMREQGVVVGSNAPLPGMRSIPEGDRSTGNTLIDMGADEFTIGTPHPMIDATERRKRILEEAHAPEVAVLLLDIVLGYNASNDPAGDLASAISEARSTARADGRQLMVIASICGTEADPQGLKAQEQILRDSGALVFSSNAQASRFARDLCLRLSKGE